MHTNSKLLFEKYAKERISERDWVLEIGPDSVPSTYETMSDCENWFTTDIKGHVDFVMEEYKIPMPSNTYDVVISGQVIEHVRKIWRWMPELARVCKKGGLVIIINPVNWPFHEAPYDCWRIYPEGMRALYEDSGLNVLLSKHETLDGGVVDTITIGTKP